MSKHRSGRHGRRAAIAALVSALLLLGVAVGAAQAKSQGFKAKPTGIKCGVTHANKRSAKMRCDYERKHAAILTRKGRGQLKHVSSGIHPHNAGVLRKGKSRKFGPFTCTSLQRAVSCRTKKHGFTVGKSVQVVF